MHFSYQTSVRLCRFHCTLFQTINCIFTLRMYFRNLRYLNSAFLPTKPSKHFPQISSNILINAPRPQFNIHSTHTSLIPISHLSTIPTISLVQYEQIAENTLQSLSDYFDSLPTIVPCSKQFDVNLADAVLTVVISDDVGTYVINKQTPNKQIWLSSPISGPKRYDLVKDRWIYLHDNSCLHDLLERELSGIFKFGLVLDGTRNFM